MYAWCDEVLWPHKPKMRIGDKHPFSQSIYLMIATNDTSGHHLGVRTTGGANGQGMYLDNKLLCSHTSNGDAALHNRSDDLHNGLVHSHGHKPFQLQSLCYGSQRRIDLYIRMQICEEALVHSSWCSCTSQTLTCDAVRCHLRWLYCAWLCTHSRSED